MKGVRRWRTVLAFTSSIACMIGLQASLLLAVPPDSTDEAIRKICERGLAISAAEYCRAQVAMAIERPALRSRWALRRMECQCQAALQSGSDSEAAWSAVVQFENEYRSEFPGDPRLPWLAWQLARADLLQAQQALARWLATPAADKQREQALQAIRRVQSRLDDLERDIKQRLPLAEPRLQAERTQATSSELQELSIDGTLLRCESLLVRARCYPDASPDRLAALADVDRTAGDMLLRAPADWSSRDELIVARATAGLEVGKRAGSLQTLHAILNGQPIEPALDPSAAPAPLTASTRARMRAGSVAVEALCADKAISQAEEALNRLKSEFTGPDVKLSQMRVQLAKLEALSAAERPAQLKSIVDQAQQLGQQYGSYWRNRGEALLVASAALNQNGNHDTASVEPQPPMQDLIAIEVRQLLAGGQTAAAVTRLRSAMSAADAAGRAVEAIDYALEAAKVLQREKDWTLATDLLLSVSTAHPDASNAPAAHVLGAWCLAQALQATTPTDSELARRYEDALLQQLQRWPAASESIKAEEYLAQWYQGKKRFEDLASMRITRAETAELAEVKVNALRQWLDATLGRLSRAQVPPQLDRLSAAIRDGKFATCERSATILLLAAQLLSSAVTQSEAEALLGFKVPGHLLEQTKHDQALLSAIISLGSARRGDATATYNALQLVDRDQLSPVVLMSWCKSLVEALDEVAPSQLSSWKAVVEFIPWSSDEPSKLTPALKMTGLRLSYLQSRDPARLDALLTEIQQLAATHTNDPYMQIALASTLAHSDDKPKSGEANRFNEAVSILKRVATGSSKGSEAYLRARWLELRWRAGRGETAAAAQIARLTLSSHNIQPAWWKARFKAAAQQNR